MSIDVSYAKFKETLRALTGIDDFSSREETFLKTLVNRRCQIAYEESRLWPRFVQEEYRYAGFDNVIPTESDGEYTIDTFIDITDVNPRNSGTSVKRYDWVISNGDGRIGGAKLLGLQDGDYLDVVHEAGTSVPGGDVVTTLSGTVRAISFWAKIDYASNGTGSSQSKSLLILNRDSALVNLDSIASIDFIFNDFDDSVTGTNTWVEAEGTSMLVYVDGIYVGKDFGSDDTGVDVTAYADGEWHHFVWTIGQVSTFYNKLGVVLYEKYLGASSQDLASTVQIADVRVYADTVDATDALLLFQNPTESVVRPIWGSSLPQYYVTYKREYPGEFNYGDGPADFPFLPKEWYLYAVHGAYADWLRSEGQTDKAMAEEQFAAEHLLRQLEKIDKNSGSPYLWSRFSTHATRQNR